MRPYLDLVKAWAATHKITTTAAAVVLALLLLRWARHWGGSAANKPKPSAATALYTGKEPKRKVSLYFASEAKALPEKEEQEIFETPSLVGQAKQVVLALLEGPKTPGLVRLFPPEAALKELFVDKSGLCVVDFNAETSARHPGGSTGEYLTLFSLVRALTDNFPEIKRVQVLIDGQRVETLAGHYDLSGPLDRSAF